MGPWGKNTKKKNNYMKNVNMHVRDSLSFLHKLTQGIFTCWYNSLINQTICYIFLALSLTKLNLIDIGN